MLQKLIKDSRVNEEAKEKLNIFTSCVGDMDASIEIIKNTFSDILIGEPNICVDSNLLDITATFHTNVAISDEALDSDSDVNYGELENKITNLFKNNTIQISLDADENGNYVIVAQKNIFKDL
jgi:hypothetical protein